MQDAMGAKRDSPLLDRDHLRRQTGGDEVFSIELAGLFQPHARQLIAGMVAADSQKTWRDACHGLKGSARGIGAVALGEAAAAAEGLLPGTAEAQAALARIESLMEPTLEALARRPLLAS